MILPTGRWKTTVELCERCNDGGVASPAEEKAIDQTCRSSILQSDVEDSKTTFPCHLWQSAKIAASRRNIRTDHDGA